MVSAIMLIKCEHGSVGKVSDALIDMEDVRELYTTTGEHDLVAILDEHDSEALAAAVTNRIGAIDGIVDTTTLLAIRQHSKRLMEGMFGVGMEPRKTGTPPRFDS